MELSSTQRSLELQWQELQDCAVAGVCRQRSSDLGGHPGLPPSWDGERAGPYEVTEPTAPAALLRDREREVVSSGGEHPIRDELVMAMPATEPPASADPPWTSARHSPSGSLHVASHIWEIPLGQFSGLRGARSRGEAGRPQPWHTPFTLAACTHPLPPGQEGSVKSLGDLVSLLLLPFLMGVLCHITCGRGPGELGGDAEAWGASI